MGIVHEIGGKDMQKKLLKNLVIIIMLTLVIATLFSITNSSSAKFDYMKNINDMAKASGDKDVTDPFQKIGGAIITIARIACTGIAVIMLIVLAIKYMSSAPSDRASIKKSAVQYVVGAVIMFAAAGILTIIQKFSAAIK